MTRKPAMSFIVRVWQTDEDGAPMQGEIEFVGTSERRFFPDRRAMLSLMEGWCRDLEPTR